LLKHINFF
jgi:hypothetical protein